MKTRKRKKKTQINILLITSRTMAIYSLRSETEQMPMLGKEWEQRR